MNLLDLRQLSRRTFLRAAAVTIGLPLLDAMLPLCPAEKAATSSRSDCCSSGACS